MRQKRIALINDFTGYSRCSVASQLPILSAMNIEVVVIPTAILNINTYHNDYKFWDFTDHMEEYIQTYKDRNMEFDGIITGFLGSAKQVDIVIDFIKYFKKENTFVLIDPVMGDHGRIYPTYNQELRHKMRELVPYATILTPNRTELCCVLHEEYTKNMQDYDTLYKMCERLHVPYTVITGLHDNDEEIINYVYEQGKPYELVKTKRIGEDRSGTGDVYCAVLAGSYLNGLSFSDSVKKAVDFCNKCIQYSVDIDAHPHCGLCFEKFLKEL